MSVYYKKVITKMELFLYLEKFFAEWSILFRQIPTRTESCFELLLCPAVMYLNPRGFLCCFGVQYMNGKYSLSLSKLIPTDFRNDECFLMTSSGVIFSFWKLLEHTSLSKLHPCTIRRVCSKLGGSCLTHTLFKASWSNTVDSAWHWQPPCHGNHGYHGDRQQAAWHHVNCDIISSLCTFPQPVSSILNSTLSSHHTWLSIIVSFWV